MKALMRKSGGRGEERDCMKVSVVTKGPVVMCSKRSDRFPEYVLLTMNPHKRSSIQPLKHASSDFHPVFLQQRDLENKNPS